jgi:hypothetical protein
MGGTKGRICFGLYIACHATAQKCSGGSSCRPGLRAKTRLLTLLSLSFSGRLNRCATGDKSVHSILRGKRTGRYRWLNWITSSQQRRFRWLLRSTLLPHIDSQHRFPVKSGLLGDASWFSVGTNYHLAPITRSTHIRRFLPPSVERCVRPLRNAFVLHDDEAKGLFFDNHNHVRWPKSSRTTIEIFVISVSKQPLAGRLPSTYLMHQKQSRKTRQ